MRQRLRPLIDKVYREKKQVFGCAIIYTHLIEKILKSYFALLPLWLTGVVNAQSATIALSLQEMREALLKKTTVVIDIR